MGRVPAHVVQFAVNRANRKLIVICGMTDAPMEPEMLRPGCKATPLRFIGCLRPHLGPMLGRGLAFVCDGPVAGYAWDGPAHARLSHRLNGIKNGTYHKLLHCPEKMRKLLDRRDLAWFD